MEDQGDEIGTPDLKPLELQPSVLMHINEKPPAISITLRPIRFTIFLVLICALIAVFTAVSTHGVVLEHVYDVVGSSKNADSKTEAYNTWSGLVLALVEVLIGAHMDTLMPVFDVFLHNSMWKAGAFLSRIMPKRCRNVADTRHSSCEAAPAMPQLRSVTLFLFPIIIALSFGNSIRSLQASNTTVGFESIIISKDMTKDQSELDKLVVKAAAAANTSYNATFDTVLKNAIRQRATPFSFVTDSKCTQKNAMLMAAGERAVPINVHDLDMSSVVYGFTLRDWNAEAITHELDPITSVTLSYDEAKGTTTSDSITKRIASLTTDTLDNAVWMLFHGKIMVEKAVGDATNQNHTCSLSDYRTDLDNGGTSNQRRLDSTDEYSYSGSDGYGYEYDDSLGAWSYDENGTRICQGPVSSVFDLFNSTAFSGGGSVSDLMDAIIAGFNKSFPYTFALDETTMTLESYNVTNQITLQALEIDFVVDKSLEYGMSECTLDNTSCDVTNYVYDDWSSAFCGDSNCVFVDTSETFSLQKEIGLIPMMLDCADVSYSGDYRGFFPKSCVKSKNSTFLYGIGSYVTGDSYGSSSTHDGLPYIKVPRRHVTFTFSFMSWELDDLAVKFDADCEAPNACNGLWYKLESSGRFLFAGESSLPLAKILRSDFHSPVQLVQLNSPSIYVPKWEMVVDLERLDKDDFDETYWDKTLGGENCSMLMQSYIEQIDENRYYLDFPMHPMYVSAFFFMMANAAVTDIDSADTAKDALGAASLKGDQQLRAVKITMPMASFKISVAGCCFLIGAMVVILALPRRYCTEKFDPDATLADQYIAMRNDGTYSELLYKKMVEVDGASQKRVTTDELEVTSMTLRGKDKTSTTIYL